MQVHTHALHSHSDKCHPPGHGSYHHPLPIYGGSSHLRDAAAPALSAPLLLLTQCQCTPSRRGGDLWVTLHPEVGSLCAAPTLPAHCWVLAAPGAPQGGCAAQSGKGSGCPGDTVGRDRPPLTAAASSPLSLPMSQMSMLPSCCF